MFTLMNKLTIILLVLILLASFIIRIYKIDSAPPSLTWDEAAVGYNAWTIANYGKDEWGESFPLVFKSFGDDKQPIPFYTVALSVKLLGLSEFSTRLPFVIFGTLTVLVIFLLAKELFNVLTGFFAAFLLALSPYHIHFSRFSHEGTLALFFFVLALLLFYLSFKKHRWWLVLSALSFGISIISYHSAKVVVPPILILLVALYYKKLLGNKTYALYSLGILLGFVALFLIEPRFLGLARAGQTSLDGNKIKATQLYQRSHNETLGKFELVSQNYVKNFSWEYLFVKGDPNPRLASQVSGQFYKIDLIFLLIGILYLLKLRNKQGIVLVSWALLAPLPASLTAEVPHAARSLFMMGSLHLVTALGIYFTFILLKKRILQLLFSVIIATVYIYSFSGFFYGYLNDFAKNYAHDFQYGMKESVNFVKENPQYTYVYVTKLRGQPYIFFLYYLKFPLPDYLYSVVYNRGEDKSFNMVEFFDKYFFDNWDPIESMPAPNVLYVLTDSEYDGLRHKALFDVKKIIYYPNGVVAFYLVSAKI